MGKSDDKLAILVVEDEEAILQGLCDALAYHGYAPHGVADGDEGLREALTGRFDLLILDVMLPGASGFDVCAEVRAALPGQSILMLTARGSEESVLEGFKRGADDYVTKPFSVSELLARVAALLRRSGRAPDGERETFSFGRWSVEGPALRAHCDGEAIDLSPREFAILRLFARECGRIVSRRMLLREVWGYANAERIETRTVDMQIGKLRKKIDGTAKPLIETVRGAGYRYSAEPD